MEKLQGQGELFKQSCLFWESSKENQPQMPNKGYLEDWRNRIWTHQCKYFCGKSTAELQTSLFEEKIIDSVNNFKPLELTPLPQNFWRHSKNYHKGPAIYVVIDTFENDERKIMLYLGETIAAEQRWKGEHDCKTYLKNYTETLQTLGIKSTLSIRFWTDVPENTRKRRNLESKLIQKWLPPFNKETRSRWQTPFTTKFSV